MWVLFAALALAGSPAAKNDSYRLIAPNQPALGIRHVSGPGRSVLYVHGATFPSDLSVGYRIEGRSWADDLHQRGFDVWSFDLAGYGGSDRPASMKLTSVPRDKVPGRAMDASRQIERIVAHI
jgi:pimeloyl-ACP methyl ester carboxylesterase